MRTRGRERADACEPGANKREGASEGERGEGQHGTRRSSVSERAVCE